MRFKVGFEEMEQGRLEEFRTVILKKNNLLHDLNELDAIEGEQIVNKMIAMRFLIYFMKFHI